MCSCFGAVYSFGLGRALRRGGSRGIFIREQRLLAKYFGLSIEAEAGLDLKSS